MAPVRCFVAALWLWMCSGAMPSPVMVLFLALICGAVSACSGDDGSRTSYATCVTRGGDYYRTIGSYPHLSDGRSADAVVQERCGRTTGAFDPL